MDLTEFAIKFLKWWPVIIAIPAILVYIVFLYLNISNANNTHMNWVIGVGLFVSISTLLAWFTRYNLKQQYENVFSWWMPNKRLPYIVGM